MLFVVTDISSNKTTIQNKEQGSYYFDIRYTLKSNSCLVLYSVLLSYLRILPTIYYPSFSHNVHNIYRTMSLLCIDLDGDKVIVVFLKNSDSLSTIFSV